DARHRPRPHGEAEAPPHGRAVTRPGAHPGAVGVPHGAEINRTLGTTVLLVEQNASMALRIASRGYVLETGRIVLEGAARDLLENPEVRDAYLGGRRATA